MAASVASHTRDPKALDCWSDALQHGLKALYSSAVSREEVGQVGTHAQHFGLREELRGIATPSRDGTRGSPGRVILTKR